MATQTRTYQRQFLEAAQRDGYAGLYWWIEATWGAGKQSSPVGYPGPWLPLVPVAPDPDASRRIAGMLAWLLKLAMPGCAGHSFDVALTHDEALQATGCKWYLWHQDVAQDAICDYCGAVEVVAHTLVEIEGVTWICEECAKR